MKITRHIINGQGQQKSIQSKAKNQAYEGTILQTFKSRTMQLKTETERGVKHRRIIKAKTEIAGKVIPDKLEKHLFEGYPNKGEFDVNNPTGLHAYREEGFPRHKYNISKGNEEETGVHLVGSGNKNKIHIIKWKWDKATDDKVKSSTMFPKWMPKKHIIALIAGVTSDTDKYIKRGLSFKVEKKGDTAYPVSE